MIRDRAGIEYPNILAALRTVRDVDRRYERDDSSALVMMDLRNLRADLDAIIASASGAAAAACACGGERAAEVEALAIGVAA